MYVQVKSSHGITTVPADTRLMAERKIFIEDEINASMANEFVKKLILLNSESTELPIDVLINSPGGEVNAGMLIYDIIQGSRAPIRLFCIGRAYSMAAVLFASGNHGRYMLPHGELMIHEPLFGGTMGGSASSIRSISEKLQETKKKMIKILAKHSGRTEEEIEKATGYDHYLTPSESIEFGLCDEIVDFDKIIVER